MQLRRGILKIQAAKLSGRDSRSDIWFESRQEADERIGQSAEPVARVAEARAAGKGAQTAARQNMRWKVTKMSADEGESEMIVA